MHSIFKICISRNMKCDKTVGFLKYSHIRIDTSKIAFLATLKNFLIFVRNYLRFTLISHDKYDRVHVRLPCGPFMLYFAIFSLLFYKFLHMQL